VTNRKHYAALPADKNSEKQKAETKNLPRQTRFCLSKKSLFPIRIALRPSFLPGN